MRIDLQGFRLYDRNCRGICRPLVRTKQRPLNPSRIFFSLGVDFSSAVALASIEAAEIEGPSGIAPRSLGAFSPFSRCSSDQQLVQVCGQLWPESTGLA